MAGLYVHIPFCKQKCLYCNFYAQSNLKLIDSFIDSLQIEITLRQSNWENTSFETIYFGGGTPSLLSIEQLQTILEALFRHFHIADYPEISIEVNPETITSSYLKDLLRIGFNRISIGVQSTHNSILNYLGRKHNIEQALSALEESRLCGFENISADLIYGITDLTDQMWAHSLETLLKLDIQHLSAYALTLEENSILWHKIKQHLLFKPDEEQAQRQFQILKKLTTEHGFEHYEISNFARPNFRSKHNSSYWHHQPYLGLGPAAHSFQHQTRYWNKNGVADYIAAMQQGQLFYECENLSTTDLYNEFVMLHLRLIEGLDLSELERLFGTSRKVYLLHELKAVNPAHYQLCENQLHLTEGGQFFADGIAAQLFDTL